MLIHRKVGRPFFSRRKLLIKMKMVLNQITIPPTPKYLDKALQVGEIVGLVSYLLEV